MRWFKRHDCWNRFHHYCRNRATGCRKSYGGLEFAVVSKYPICGQEGLARLVAGEGDDMSEHRSMLALACLAGGWLVSGWTAGAHAQSAPPLAAQASADAR